MSKIYGFIDHHGRRYQLVDPTRKDVGLVTVAEEKAAVSWIVDNLYFRISWYGFPNVEVFKLEEVRE